MKCEECNYNYPSRLLSPMQSSKGNTGPICGICALELSNKVLSLKRDKFNGPRAESMRLEALKYRERLQKEKEKQNA